MSWGLNPRVWFVCLCLLAGALATLPTYAQDDASKPAGPDVTGTWLGKLDTPGGGVELTVVMKWADGQWTGTLQAPQRDPVAMKSVTVQTDGTFTFTYRSERMPSDATWKGQIDDKVTLAKGELSAAFLPMAIPLNFAHIDDGSGSVTDGTGAKKYRPGSGPAGSWIGKVEAHDGQEIEVHLQLDQDSGKWVAGISDPVMGDVRGDNVRVSDNFISFDFRPADAPFPATFAGSYIAADDRITGTVSQRGASRFIKFRREPGTVMLATIGPDGKLHQPPPIRHGYRFAVTARAAWWIAVKAIKDDTYNLNNITTNDSGMDATLKWFPLDGACFFARAFRGGLGYDTTDEKLAAWQEIGLSKDAYLKLDGFEFGVMGYLGNKMMRDSRFNPYLTATGGRVNWALMTDGRDSPVIGDRVQPLQGADWCFGFGFGTEYKLSDKFCLELEWLWRYFLTGDSKRFPDEDTYWTNTHAWNLSLGLTYGFF